MPAGSISWRRSPTATISADQSSSSSARSSRSATSRRHRARYPTWLRPRRGGSMFKAAKEGPAKVITANDLRDGLVVFLTPDGGWSHDIAEARIVEDGADLDSANTYAKAQHDARIVVEPYPIDVTVTNGIP